MFFSPELLSKRDSGFGLLWLAATLGSKSSFRKLPRRSIQTADIPQLCNLISHPSEPLALRLSSNLMVGVARVYKIKHEIFVTDVSNCFAHLKRAVQEIYALGALSEAQLQMGQPSVRPDLVTLTVDPAIAVAFEFDAFDTNWADISGIGTNRQRDTEDDNEFTLGGNKSKSKSKQKSKTFFPPSETGRANLHMLDEHHELLLSTSFDANASFLAGFDPSSSQIDPAMRFGSYAFDDDLFGPGANFDLGLGDIGDELARELGEGWGVNVPNISLDVPMNVDQQIDFQTGVDFDMGLDPISNNLNVSAAVEDGKRRSVHGRKRPFAESDKENLPPTLTEGQALTPRSVFTHNSQTSAPRSFAEELIANDNQVDVPELIEGQTATENRVIRKPKKLRIQLDVRTELTDEELRASRARYVQEQRAIRLDTERRKFEKDGGKVLEDMILGVPEGLTAPALANFWSEIFRIQIASRSGNLHLTGHDERITKRQRKIYNNTESPHDRQNEINRNINFGGNDYSPMDYDFGMDIDFNAPVNFDDVTRLRSSEEPERGRDAAVHASRFDLDFEALNPSSGTQRNTFFPWDNAAGTSSADVGFAPIGEEGSDHLSLDKADVRIMRSHSQSGSRDASFSVVPSQSGSTIGLNLGISPSGRRGSALVDDFQFDVTNDAVPGQDMQETENNVVMLERTSYNFLEYCKMQAQALPSGQKTLGFNDVVPTATSSRRVAAAAFHHCLVLATKYLIVIGQEGAYGALSIKIK